MKIIPEPLEFEWDKGNTDKIFKKHKVKDKEAEEIFKNGDFIIFDDQRHSQFEQRYGAYGIINTRRLLSIAFTIRNKKVRVITARDMSRIERRSYEKLKKNT
ncbi:hypothetical protein A2768_00780 [Candidatus Roizmanbacteria bacterium RIFCSPHIGHO2_01_FULL_37_16]|nr:MAG: hypothetical protein A2768_00780 [Candidatus Roizmanbacteria bacterium RIFCSPHIGHO2_01_FULL_37_16]